MLFFLLPKSQTARAKAQRLSRIELEIFSMHLTAAFLRPDCHSRALDYFHTVVNGFVYELMTIEIDVAIITLAFHPNGKMAILDFLITAPLIPFHPERGPPL